MLLFKTVSDLQNHLKGIRASGKTVGFVPTMGALHAGHVSLIKKAIQATDSCVCSIFVNPTQFNESSDLNSYPRTPSADIDRLVAAGCHILFMPPVEEVYPGGERKEVDFDFGYLDQPMEGAHRPGHFKGMAQVVGRLLEIVSPDSLFMGQKDYQQYAIVAEMLRQANSTTELIMCPIVREEDGLAMSSRNLRLDRNQRLLAPNIYRTLKKAVNMVRGQSPKEIQDMAMSMLSVQGMEPEYFEIVDGETLRPLTEFTSGVKAVACTAVRIGEVRLIDNMVLVG